MAQLLLFLVFFFTSAKSNENLVLGSNEFGYDLSNELYTDSSANTWISPFCITSCFSLIYAGSNGNTQTQIANVLGYPSDIETAQVTQHFFLLQSLIENTYNGMNRASIIGIANKIYSSKSLALKQSYIDALNDGTESFIDSNFDFVANNATTIINEWVNANTNGLIENIIPPTLDISAWRLVAMNAIYLNGTFSKQFDPTMTSDSHFYSNANRATFTVPLYLMHQMDYFYYHSNGDYQFLKFPFSDSDDLFVLFALPMNNNVGSLTDVNIAKTAITKLELKYIALALPKLSISATYTLNNALQDLGMTDAFDMAADFSGISDEPLVVDKVIHKTMIEMDEKGLIAAAVTLIGMVEMAAIETTRPTPILFKADHPFQMFIIDGEHDNVVLFMGQINNPGIPDGSDVPTYDESSDMVWTNYDLIGDGDDDSDSDKLNIASLVVVIAAVCVVVIAVLAWCFFSSRNKKEVFFEQDKVESKNFVELNPVTNEMPVEDQEVEVTKESEIQSSDSPPN